MTDSNLPHSSNCCNRTVTVEETEQVVEPVTPVLRLKLKKPKTHKKVGWTEDTVDNEHLNKKKSKCCCIYEKPRAFAESSSDTDDECDNCRGHVEIKKKSKEPPTNRKKPTGNPNPPDL